LLLALGCIDYLTEGEEQIVYPASPTIVRILVEARANVNARDEHGRTPMIWAAYKGEIESVHVLANNGADLNAADQQGLTALQAALMIGPHSLGKWLVERGNL